MIEFEKTNYKVNVDGMEYYDFVELYQWLLDCDIPYNNINNDNCKLDTNDYIYHGYLILEN